MKKEELGQNKNWPLKNLPRLKNLQKLLGEKRLDTILVSANSNRAYLTSWFSDEESGFVLITAKKSFIITDSRYSEHAAQLTRGFEIIETAEGFGPVLRDLVKTERIKSIGFESHDLSVFSFKRIKKFLKGVKLVPVVSLVEGLRAVKDETEIKAVKKAVSIADAAFHHILSFVKPGVSEKEIAWEIENFLKEKGSEGVAWSPFIVAAGAHSSMAHWGASDSNINKGDMVLLDYGCVYQGYHSDISRVIFVGLPSDEQGKIYNLVLEAQKYGISLVKEGRAGAMVDKKVRGFLEKHLPIGIAPEHIYRHALGHGVGLEIHELPSVNIHRKSRLVSGNVTTIEPGIYIPGWGGVRIEDVVLVTKNGCEVLTKASKEIREVTV